MKIIIPKLSLPVGKIKTPKFLYIILIILGVLVLIVGGLSLYLKNIKKSTEKSTKNVEVIDNKTMANKASGGTKLSSANDVSEISNKLISWLDKQRDDRGVYSENETCDNEVCNNGSSSNRSGFSVLNGKVMYEKKINQIIIDDLNKYANKDIVQVIQSNYLICNFLYDLYFYPNANEEVKNLTEKICFNVQYELDSQEDYSAIFNTENTEDTTSLLNKSLQKLENILVKKETVNTTSDNFDITRKYGFYVSEFATRYKWKNKDEDYRGFLITLNQFLEEYGNSNSKFKEGEECGLALGLITMGETKQITDFKKYGELIYSKEVIEKNINEMTLKQMLTCGLLANKMNDKKMVNSFVNKIIADFYDKNRGCVGQQNPEFVTNIYDVKNNGIFLILLNSGIKES